MFYDSHSLPEYEEPEEKGKNVNYLTEQESEILRVLTKAGCSSAPKLLAEEMFTQSEDMCDPGGYVMCIVMEALPGVPLDPNEYWEFDREKRDMIREAFRLALMYVSRYRISYAYSHPSLFLICLFSLILIRHIIYVVMSETVVLIIGIRASKTYFGMRNRENGKFCLTGVNIKMQNSLY